MKYSIFFACLWTVSATLPTFGQTHTQEGAVLGGVAGAIAGGIIGHQNDETPEGAIIGGVLGAVTGGALGNAKDHQIARDRYYRSQIAYQQQQRLARAVSIPDVIQMSRSGLSPNLIIGHIQANGVQRRLETHDIIAMHQQGVSENVIDAMQRAAVGGTRVVSPAPPVVVQRRVEVVPHYVPSYRVYHPPRYHYHYHRRRW